MFGLYNSVLRVNATQKSFDLKTISDELVGRHFGRQRTGHSPAASTQSCEGRSFGPDNHLVFATGL